MTERGHAPIANHDPTTPLAHDTAAPASTSRFVAHGALPPVASDHVMRAKTASEHAYGDEQPVAKLPPEERPELIAETRTHLGNAYTAFTGACMNIKLELLEAANADADMIAVIGIVLFGLALPGIGTLAAPALARLAKLAPESAKFLEHHHEVIAEAVAGAGEIGLEAYKDRSPAMAAATDANAFIDQLNASTQLGIQQMQDGLPSLSTEHVAGLWAAYDATVANTPAFTTKIRGIVASWKNVQKIGTKRHRKFGRGGDVLDLTESCILAYVADPAGKRLAVLDELESPGMGAPEQFTIVDYVPDELRAMAIAKAGGGEPPTYDPASGQLVRA